MLSVELLGHFYLKADGEIITAVRTQRQQALLAYLILYRHRPQLRQQIALDLWGEFPRDRAQANLRRDLYRLRHLLPEIDSCLQIDTKTLHWLGSSPTQVDVIELEAHLQQAKASHQPNIQRFHLEQVARLYQGELLPTCDDQWILPLREQFQQQAFDAIERLLALLEQQQEYTQAITLASKLVHLDPLHEAGYQALMQAYQAHNDRTAALRTYHQCRTVLREEMGIDPSAGTQVLYQQVLTADLVDSSV